MATVTNAGQMTLDFEPGLAAKYPTLLHVMANRVHTHRDQLKTVAANIDRSGSMLSRLINTDPHQDPDQRRVFNVEDLEKYIQAYDDMTPILYLVEKYMQDDDSKQRRALSQIAVLAPMLLSLCTQAGLAPTKAGRK